MPYISHAELAERPGARELAQVATPDGKTVIADDLMDATLRGLDRGAWRAEDIADADAALRRIDDAVSEADAVIDGYLAKRGYAVPMDLSAASTRKLIAGWSRAIARYLLQKDGISDEKTSPIARAMGMTAEVRQSIQKLIDDPATDAHQRAFWKARLDAKTMTDAELLNEVLVDWELRDNKDQFVPYTPAARAELEEDLDGIETSLVKAYFDAINKPVTAEEVEKNSEAQPVITS